MTQTQDLRSTFAAEHQFVTLTIELDCFAAQQIYYGTLAGSDPGQAEQNPAHIVSKRMQRQSLWQLVNQLDDRLRLPILMRYRYGMAGDEIAAALGLATSTVYEQLSQGRKQLRQMRKLQEAGLPFGGSSGMTSDA